MSPGTRDLEARAAVTAALLLALVAAAGALAPALGRLL